MSTGSNELAQPNPETHDWVDGEWRPKSPPGTPQPNPDTHDWVNGTWVPKKKTGVGNELVKIVVAILLVVAGLFVWGAMSSSGAGSFDTKCTYQSNSNYSSGNLTGDATMKCS